MTEWWNTNGSRWLGEGSGEAFQGAAPGRAPELGAQAFFRRRAGRRRGTHRWRSANP
jgi:hypothetical protein